MTYSIEEHKHRFSSWAASRAASTSTCRFNVLQGKNIIEAVGLSEIIGSPALLPAPHEIDSAHRKWRNSAIDAAALKDLIGFSHGIAAKLINVYLKSTFVCAGHEYHPSVAALHPPIDRLLLGELDKQNLGGQGDVWAKATKLRWSKFNSEQYESVITAIRAASGGSDLWKIEAYWRGHQ